MGDSVTSINDNAFSSCINLTSITIPNHVTSIGKEAFRNCATLESITIPDTVTGIGASAFVDCRSLASVAIGRGMKSIEDSVFGYCRALMSITIPYGVMSIGTSAFEYCSNLSSIMISDSVTSIGSKAFKDCESLASITVSENNPEYHSSNNCLIETNSKVLLLGCKNSIIPSDGSVKCIGDYAFCGCAEMKGLTIPEGVTTIGKFAFSGKITSITIAKSITSIDASAFKGCMGLASIYYEGDTIGWENLKVTFGIGDCHPTIYYYSETRPTDTANQYWHYVKDAPRPW